MHLDGLIYQLPKTLKALIGVFIITLSIGFYTGLAFVNETTDFSSNGIVENYTGNEHNENAVEMKFKKSKREMITLVHNHILSLSVIFFILGSLVSITALPTKFKRFLIIEPLLSLIFTFGGLFLLWDGLLWMKYIVMLSGLLMTLSFVLATGIIFYQLIFPKKN